MDELRESAKPYAGKGESHPTLPEMGMARDEVLEAGRWQDGYVSGAVYHGHPRHIEFLNEAYAITSQTNPLQSDLWPSIAKYEAEIVSMTAEMLGAARASDAAGDHVCEPRPLEPAGEEQNEVSLGHARRLLSPQPQLGHSTKWGAAGV